MGLCSWKRDIECALFTLSGRSFLAKSEGSVALFVSTFRVVVLHCVAMVTVTAACVLHVLGYHHVWRH